MSQHELTAREVVRYLLDKRLLLPAALTEGKLVVVDVSRRNRNYQVRAEGGHCFLVKQGVGEEGRMTVAHEARFYTYARSLNGDSLRRYLPGFHGFDEALGILVLELLDAEDARHYLGRIGRFPAGLASGFGEALAALHRLKPDGTGASATPPVTMPQPPGALFLHRPHLPAFRDLSRATLQVLQIVQRFSEFGESLDALRAGWRVNALIHLDLKWDNWLVLDERRCPWNQRLRLVDWELACPGDAAWDVGSVFNDCLSHWLLSIPVTGQTPPERFPELARHPLERMQPALRAFWQSYTRSRPLDIPASHDLLWRSSQYAAVRLLQSAFEQMQASPQLTGYAVCCLQVALNILRRPQEAATHLFGIPMPDGNR